MMTISDNKSEYIWQLIAQTRAVLFKIRSRQLAVDKLNPIQIGILWSLMKNGGSITPGELGNESLKEPHTISSVLKRMELKKLIYKTRYANGKVIITITEDGKDLLEHVESQSNPIHKIVSVLSDEESKVLEKLLLKLITKGRDELGALPLELDSE